MTPEEFREAERRKMRLQADIAARRNSLMTMGTPPQIPTMRGIDALEGPESTGLTTTHTPTRAEIDARQFTARMRDQQNNLDRSFVNTSPASTDPDILDDTQPLPPSVVDGITVAPGAKNAGVPGNRSRIAELFGLSDATRQRNFNQQAFDERTHGEGQRFPSVPRSRNTGGVAFPSEKRLKSASENLSDAVRQIKKRVSIIRGTSALLGGDSKAADRYEAKAMASLNEYAGRYALSNLNDTDFQSKQKLLQALIRQGMSVSQALEVIESGVVKTQDVTKPDRFKRKETDEDGKTWEITEQWNPKTGTMDFISKAEVRTTPLVQMLPGETEGTKASAIKFADTYSALVDDPDRTYANLKSENDRIRQLETAIERGMPTGFGTAPMLDFQRFVLKMIPPALKENSEFFDTFKEKIGTQEWWQATSERFIGGMLAMTKGSVSDREMKIFMGMIPSLSTTPAGNRKLLRMMYEMNSLALVDHLAAKELNKWLVDNDMSGVGQLTTPKAREKLEEFRQKQEKLARARFNEAMKPDTVEEAALQIKALNSWMTSEQAMEEAAKVFK